MHLKTSASNMILHLGERYVLPIPTLAMIPQIYTSTDSLRPCSCANKVRDNCNFEHWVFLTRVLLFLIFTFITPLLLSNRSGTSVIGSTLQYPSQNGKLLLYTKEVSTLFGFNGQTQVLVQQLNPIPEGSIWACLHGDNGPDFTSRSHVY